MGRFIRNTFAASALSACLAASSAAAADDGAFKTIRKDTQLDLDGFRVKSENVFCSMQGPMQSRPEAWGVAVTLALKDADGKNPDLSSGPNPDLTVVFSRTHDPARPGGAIISWNVTETPGSDGLIRRKPEVFSRIGGNVAVDIWGSANNICRGLPPETADDPDAPPPLPAPKVPAPPSRDNNLPRNDTI